MDWVGFLNYGCGRIWDLIAIYVKKKNYKILLYSTLSPEGSKPFWGKWTENNGGLLSVIMIIEYCYSGGAKSLS